MRLSNLATGAVAFLTAVVGVDAQCQLPSTYRWYAISALLPLFICHSGVERRLALEILPETPWIGIR
jgi:hypothetical protein